MATININSLVNNLIIITTNETLESDLELKIMSALTKVLLSTKVPGQETPESNLDKD